MTRLPPGPPAIRKNPIALLRYAQHVGNDMLGFQQGRFERYGDTYAAQVGKICNLVTRDPACIQQVLVEDGDAYQKPESGIGVAQLRRFLGTGLISSNGEQWRTHRRQIQPAFDARHLRAYADTIARYAAEHFKGWTPGDEIDVSREMMSLTLRVVGKVLMGKDVRATRDNVAGAMTAFRDSFGGLSAILPRWLPYPPWFREQRAITAMRALIDSFIAEHAATNPGADVDQDCLLHVLSQGLKQPDSMSREQLRDEALTLFFAGHETTSHAVSWTLYLLAKHPEVRERVASEVEQVLGDRLASFEDLPKLSYTLHTLEEGMRLFPPAPTVIREARRDTTLGEYAVAKGTHVIVSIYHVHRDARWHPDPERFDPERFQPEAAKRMVPGSYVPFGAGTRTCIGKRFALMEATLILATLAQNRRLELLDEREPAKDTSITLAPHGGIPMRVLAL